MKTLDINNSGGLDTSIPRFGMKKYGRKGREQFNTPIQPTYYDKPSLDEMRYDDRFSSKKQLAINNSQMNKKSILKKYTGKGGPKMGVSDFQRMQRQDDQKLDASKAPSPFSMVGSAIKSGLSGIKSLGGKVINSYAAGFKAVDAAKKVRDDKMKTDNWGSPENYDKLQKMPILKRKLGK